MAVSSGVVELGLLRFRGDGIWPARGGSDGGSSRTASNETPGTGDSRLVAGPRIWPGGGCNAARGTFCHATARERAGWLITTWDCADLIMSCNSRGTAWRFFAVYSDGGIRMNETSTEYFAGWIAFYENKRLEIRPWQADGIWGGHASYPGKPS